MNWPFGRAKAPAPVPWRAPTAEEEEREAEKVWAELKALPKFAALSGDQRMRAIAGVVLSGGMQMGVGLRVLLLNCEGQ